MATSEEIVGKIHESCISKGLECYPFKVQWYNDKVQPAFHLPYYPNTLGVLIVSSPSMFERLFIPYLSSSDFKIVGQLDPIDQCLKDEMHTMKEHLFPLHTVDIMQDFELHPASRRPKVLVQTMGHIAGAARYYQRSDVDPDPWDEKEKIYGVSVHPKYGGWFALRGVMIFKDVLAPELIQKDPVDCVPSRELRIELLEKFNRHWQDWSYRDVSGTGIEERYSREQKDYFGTEPRLRSDLIDTLRLRYQQGTAVN